MEDLLALHEATAVSRYILISTEILVSVSGLFRKPTGSLFLIFSCPRRQCSTLLPLLLFVFPPSSLSLSPYFAWCSRSRKGLGWDGGGCRFRAFFRYSYICYAASFAAAGQEHSRHRFCAVVCGCGCACDARVHARLKLLFDLNKSSLYRP